MKPSRESEPASLASQTVTEPQRKIPVIYDVDVAVAGTGLGGILAALAAGRLGAKVLLVDRFGQLGGNIGPGMWAGGSLHLALVNERDPAADKLLNRTGMGGVAEEFHRRTILARPNADAIPPETLKELAESHYNVSPYRLGAGAELPGYFVDSLVASHVALEMLDEVQAETLMSVYAADPIMEQSMVKGLFVETKSGRLAVRAKVTIDATGQADIVFRAGASVKRVANPNLGLWWSIGNVDWDKYVEFRESQPEPEPKELDWLRKVVGTDKNEADPYHDIHHLLCGLRHAWQRGEFEFVRQVDRCQIRFLMNQSPYPGTAQGRTGTAGEVDFSEARAVSLMEREHREYVYRLARFFRKYIPGFENSYLMVVSPFLGARGGRYIDAVYSISQQDLELERSFEDVMYVYHDRRSQKSMEVPYRAMLPRELDGILASGRSSVVYGPNLRGRCFVMLHGQAAGVAAALCVREGVTPQQLDPRHVQRVLLDWGCPLGDEKRLCDLGLTD